MGWNGIDQANSFPLEIGLWMKEMGTFSNSMTFLTHPWNHFDQGFHHFKVSSGNELSDVSKYMWQ